MFMTAGTLTRWGLKCPIASIASTNLVLPRNKTTIFIYTFLSQYSYSVTPVPYLRGSSLIFHTIKYLRTKVLRNAENENGIEPTDL